MKSISILVGAAIGGIVGFFLFRWLLMQGMYGIMVPGSLLGFGASFVSHRSRILPIVCGIAAVLLGLFSEWHERPFIADPSFTFFLSHVLELTSGTLLMIGVGGAVGYWLPNSRYKAAPLICSKCNSELNAGDKFCPSCGTRRVTFQSGQSE